MLAEFLREKATECEQVARNCFDLNSMRKLRLMAQQMRAVADKIEGKKPRGR